MTPEQAAPNLRRWNIALAILHAAQGVAILLLSNGFTLGVTIPYMVGPPGSPILGTEPVWQVPIATFVAVFLFLAALDHLLCALPGIDRWYIANLGRGTNPLRGREYSVSATLMNVLIAIAGANVGLMLFGLALELLNPAGTERVDWRPFFYGCFTGAFAWFALGFVLIRAKM